MGSATKVQTVHFAAQEHFFFDENSPVVVSVGDSPDVASNLLCPGLMVLQSGWYECSPALTGLYFGVRLPRLSSDSLSSFEIRAYPGKLAKSLASVSISGDSLATSQFSQFNLLHYRNNVSSLAPQMTSVGESPFIRLQLPETALVSDVVLIPHESPQDSFSVDASVYVGFETTTHDGPSNSACERGPAF